MQAFWATAAAEILNFPPSENRKSVMLQSPPQLPDLSVDFMSWINAELRRRIEGPKPSEEQEDEKSGIVNRLKAYLIRA